MDDGRWLAAQLGVETAAALMPHVDVAERNRLVRVHGYAKDNAWPPPLSERLIDPEFAQVLFQSAAQDGLGEVVTQLLQETDPRG